VVHVVAHEECGPSTLARIAREARAGDSVLFFGPRSEAERLRDRRLPSPLAIEVPVRAIPRVGGNWITVLPDARVLEPGSALGSIVERALSRWNAARHGVVDELRMPRFYGPRARALFSRLRPVEMGRDCDAPVPGEPPPAVAWSDERRTRIRRELGLAPREVALVLAGDPSEWIDGSFVARAVGMAFVSGAPLRLVFSPRMPRVAELARFLVSATSSPAPIVDARADTPWELLPALDGAIVDADGRATQPVACRGLRSAELVVELDGELDEELDEELESKLAAKPRDRHESESVSGTPREVRSAQPALWAIASGRPAFVHASIDLGALASSPGVRRFGDSVAGFAHALGAFGREVQATRATSASAASR
jgi:hypothetical protein